MATNIITPLSQALSEGMLTRAELRSFMTRSNGAALRHFGLFLIVMAATGMLVWMALGNLWLVPAMFLHGIVMVHHFSLQHECIHYTVFRTRWLNELVGNYCGLVIILPNRFFRYEHCDHHTYTQIENKDPELLLLPRSLWDYAFYMSSIPYWKTKFVELFRRVGGHLTAEEKRFVPKVEHRSLIIEARCMTAFYGAIFCFMLIFNWWAPLWFWLIPVLIGEPVMRFIRFTEHVGRPMVTEMRQNTRTSLVSPIWGFLCWNMNYHAEHHYVPSAPFHALSALHEKLKNHIHIEPNGYFGAHKDILSQIIGRKSRSDSLVTSK